MLSAKRAVFGPALSLVAVLAITSSAFAAGGSLRGSFTGEAWATRANAVAGDIAIKLGRSAYQVCPCLGTNGAVVSNTVDQIRAGQAFSAAATLSTAQAEKVPDKTAYVITVSEITDVRALDGLVTADMIRARAVTRVTTAGFTTSSAGSWIGGLRVAGQLIAVSPGLRVNLPGFGYLLVKDVRRSGDGVTQRSIQVEMLRIVITRNNHLGIPIGSLITVGHARAGYTREQPVGLVGGTVYAAAAMSSVPGVENRVGRAAAEWMGCFAKGEITRRNKVERVTAPGLLVTGAGETSLYGAVNAVRALGLGKSRINNVNLLDGFFTADVILGVAEAKRTAGGTRTTSFTGSHFVNLRVGGVAIGDDVAPNTELVIPSLGRVVLYETATTTTASLIAAQVTMVHVYIDTANGLGLPVGTQVRLAYARTQVQTP